MEFEVTGPQANSVGYRQKIKTQWNVKQCREGT